jgi:Rrf2 family iron-sulfur cluster assembly transcriptional regulator
MHIPIKVDYGVRALVDLALHADDQPIRASEIAGRTLIPEPYLAQVMHSLSKAGMVRSQRGPLGGHALAMAADDIRLSMVMDCLGSTENLVACLDNPASCIHVPLCAQKEVWQSVELAVFSILDSKTIADLVSRGRAMAVSAALSGAPRPLVIRGSEN